LEKDAAISRIQAGAAYTGDVEAGLRVGRAVGARAIARARRDGSDAAWPGTRPSGEGIWQPTPPAFIDPPLEPLAGTWATWVVSDVQQSRPTPPPTYGSAAWRAELAGVQDAVSRRTPEQADAANFWAGSPGTVTPGGLWIEIARNLILKAHLDTRHAARVLALTSVAIADGFVCCWDTKYAYWTLRPITADPTLDVLFPTPPFPSYPSGHSTISFAAAAILGHLFPAAETDLRDRAEEARDSRLWAGIHYPIDNEMGAASGGAVGRQVANYARNDGAE
jgi:membrane-associated phospholipid phosphatase